MNLSGIIAISGKPGLFKVVAQAKNSIIVESLLDGKRCPAYAADRISALEDISIYTYSKDKPLKEIYRAIFEKEGGKECPSHKDKLDVLTNYLLSILPDYDAERVYSSDIKKLFQWYNLLHKSGNLILEEEQESVPKKKAGAKAKEEEDSEEKPNTTKASAEGKKSSETTAKKPAKKEKETNSWFMRQFNNFFEENDSDTE